MGPYITTDELKARVAAAISKNVNDLVAKWTDIIAAAVTDGYTDLRQYMLNPRMGYTQAQLDAWDDRKRYNMDQSLFWALVNGAGLSGFDPSSFNKLDHRAEMGKPGFTIFINGEVAIPGAIAAGNSSVMAGTMLAADANGMVGGVDLCSTFGTQAERRRGMAVGPWLDRGWSS